MTGPVIVLDSGAIDQVVRNKEFRGVVEGLLRSGWTPVTPTAVLAETITGRPTDAPANQVIGRIGTTVTDGLLARQAGALRRAAAETAGRRVPSGIDAIVAAHATDAGAGVVFTTDPADIRRLLAPTPRIRVERP
jgi:hypothetical protein